MNPDFVLTNADRLTPTWQKILKILDMKLEAARASLESTAKTPSETDVLRGQIKTLRSLILLNQDVSSMIESE
jgi:hypothetical protein